ncbi:fructose-2,6-bisphosphatase [Lachnospiraceae bacterium JC7]|nr:fructose-2,6-bisphosphatase [Lachnospiraceae bacterium JC7]
MKLLIIRHGDPDYEHDSLTETGWMEATLLAERLFRTEKIKEFYVSPMGRARDTASLTLKKYGKTAMVMPWLREFNEALIKRPDVPDREMISWDWLPQDWTKELRFYDPEHWMDVDVFRESSVPETFHKVTSCLDEFLLNHGYHHEGNMFRVEHANSDTIALFCHFGVECVLLAHLLHISPMQLWHGFCAAPSSVTTIYTEERRKGSAQFRVASFGDISHLYAGDRSASFAARFAEIYGNGDRID